jgi:2'-5' RNA ligase
VREPGRLKAASLVDGLTERIVGSVRVDAITLFHSKLSPKGPTYTPLLRLALGEPDDPLPQPRVGSA